MKKTYICQGPMKGPDKNVTNINITGVIAEIVEQDGLWMMINNPDGPSAWPIERDEIIPILLACEKWVNNGYKSGNKND